MKKTVGLLALVLAAALLLCGCAGLPDGFDEEAATARALEIVGFLSARDYEAVEDATRDDVKEALSAQVLERALGGLIADLGEFEQVSSTAVSGTTGQSGEEYGVVVVIAQYENGAAQYTLSFDRELMLVGLYMK